MSALRPTPTPQVAEIETDGSLRVVWRDGHVSRFAAADLRAKCPCAGCVDEWSGEVKVHRAQIAADLVARAVHRVGNYALSIEWSDGHSTGIYAYASLRAMCECSVCRA